MEKKLEIGNINHYGDDVQFKITEQSHYEGEFWNEGNSFKASNGVCLKSIKFPQICYFEGVLTFYVRGSNRGYDTLTLCTSRKNFEKIKQAIEEYNEFFSEKIKLTEKDIRCIHKMEHKMTYTTEDGVDIKTVPDEFSVARNNCSICILHGKAGCMVFQNREYPWTCSKDEFHYEKA